MEFRPSNSLSAQIADYVGTRIIKGELKSGERIKEVNLARELGVSRGPIREALHILARQRLIEVTPRRGARVVQMSSDYATWLYDIIVELYGLAAKRAGENCTSKDIIHLRRALKKIKDCAGRGDVSGYYNGIFQLALAGERAAGNPLLEQMLSDLEPVTRRVQYVSLKRHTEDLKKSIAFLERFVQGAEEHDGEKACQSIKAYTKHERQLSLRGRSSSTVGAETGEETPKQNI